MTTTEMTTPEMITTATTAPETTTDTILAFVTHRFPFGEISPSEDIFSLGHINSLFAMELVMFLEKTFAITIPNDELRIDTFRSADSMTALVDRLREGRS